jgi:hypothetical protein
MPTRIERDGSGLLVKRIRGRTLANWFPWRLGDAPTRTERRLSGRGSFAECHAYTLQFRRRARARLKEERRYMRRL